MADEKKKTHSQKYKHYKIEGESVKRENPTCPKCGAGVFLAIHKDRKTCGTCGYMEKN